MLTIDKKMRKKGMMKFNHTGTKANTTITVRVNDSQKAFIEANVSRIHFDVNTMHFNLTNYTLPNNKKVKKISLAKAMWISNNPQAKTVPIRLPQLPIVA
jgi:hypothetical protein